jgi:hypothetical protein
MVWHGCIYDSNIRHGSYSLKRLPEDPTAGSLEYDAIRYPAMPANEFSGVKLLSKEDSMITPEFPSIVLDCVKRRLPSNGGDYQSRKNAQPATPRIIDVNKVHSRRGRAIESAYYSLNKFPNQGNI